jgi:hypothetical protein
MTGSEMTRQRTATPTLRSREVLFDTGIDCLTVTMSRAAGER